MEDTTMEKKGSFSFFQKENKENTNGMKKRKKFFS